MLASSGSTPSLMPGYRLDRYELLAPVAEGGMGAVWLARLSGKRGFEKLVAIKVPKISGDVSVSQMMLDEARIASSIDHPNVAKILDLGEQGDLLYIVMEWVDGVSLSGLTRVLDKRKIPLPLPLALRILGDTCGGLHAAHELRGQDGRLLEVVHRDISPQNLLVTSGGNVKLIDFGIAKARSRSSGDTTDGTLKGKIKYMAPEQALSKKLDRRADIFALGSVLYRLISGRPPYEGDSELATLHALISGAQPEPLPPSTPKPVVELTYKALAASPDARFQTALEMQQAIGRAMADAELVAESVDIAAFLQQHIPERLESQRNAIELALKAAAERATMNALLCAPDSSPSLSSAGDGTPSSRRMLVAAGTVTVPGTTSEVAPAYEASAPPVGPTSKASSRRIFAAALALGAIAVVGLVAIGASRQRVEAPLGSAPPPSSLSSEPVRAPSTEPAGPEVVAAPKPSASASPRVSTRTPATMPGSPTRAAATKPVAPTPSASATEAPPPVVRPVVRPRPSSGDDFGY